MKHNLTQAAKLAGVSRSTINRHVKDGTISKTLGKDGKPYIDTSELQRVYGNLSQGHSATGQPVEQRRTPQKDIENTVIQARLEAENQLLRDQLEQTRQDRDEWRKQAQQLALAPPQQDNAATASNSPAEKGRRLFGWFGSRQA